MVDGVEAVRNRRTGGETNRLGRGLCVVALVSVGTSVAVRAPR